MIGTATIEVSVNRALVLLSVGTTLLRRRWLEDNTRSDNPRLTSVRAFDTELKMLRRAIAGGDSDKFELGVASILYLHGLAPMVQLETDAPDIVAQTHRGRTLLVECTLKSKDAQAKVGKLVDRRAQLARAEESSGSGLDIVAMLVTAQTREQAKWLSDVCLKQAIILLTAEDLQDDLDAAQGPPDAERWVERLKRRVSSASGDEAR